MADLQAAIGLLHRSCSGGAVERGAEEPKDADGAIQQLVVGRFEIDHEIAVDRAAANKDRCRDGIERRLGGRSGSQSRGASQQFCAGVKQEQVGAPRGTVTSCTGEQGGGGASGCDAASMRAEHPRRRASGGDAEHGVVGAYIQSFQFRQCARGVVFHPFGGSPQGGITACNQTDDIVGRRSRR